MLAIRLPEEIEARLRVLAERTGRSKSFYVTRGRARASGRPRGLLSGSTAAGGTVADDPPGGGGAAAWLGGLSSIPVLSRT